MTAMSVNSATNRLRRSARAALALGALAATLAAGGCGTGLPQPVSASELAEAQTFPYYRLYWTGPSFDGEPLSAADGLKGYVNTVGASVYYGDCVEGKGIFGGGSCVLPLQVTTVIYTLHANVALGPQRNMLIRGVPATVYDEGHSIEIYTGRVAVDIFSDTFARALLASSQLRPVNAPGAPAGELPAPVYCPGLSGPTDTALTRVLAELPHEVCRRVAAEQAFIRKVGSR
jgi:hypothetical protein